MGVVGRGQDSGLRCGGGFGSGAFLRLFCVQGGGGGQSSFAGGFGQSVCGRFFYVLAQLALWVRGCRSCAYERGWGFGVVRLRVTDYLFKFLLVGDSDVGKGEILQDGAVEFFYIYSNWIDYETIIILSDGQRVRLLFWDASGWIRLCIRFRFYFRSAQGFFLLYDIINGWFFGRY